MYSVAGVVAGLLGFFWISRANRRAVLLAAILIGLSADVTAVWLHSYAAIAGGRFISGLAASSVMIIVSATIALSLRSERLFGLLVAGQSLLSVVFFYLLPRVSWGLSGLFILFVVLWAISLPCALLVPHRVEDVRANNPAEADSTTPASRLLRPSVLFLLIAFASFYIGTGAFWTYANLIGSWHMISDASVGSAMSLSMFFAILGALVVTAMGKKYGRFWPLLLGLVANVAFTLILLAPIGVLGFAVAVCGINLITSLVLALYLTIYGDVDSRGRLLSIANIIIFGGLALGPWILGSTANGGNYRVLLIGTVAFFAVSPVLLAVGYSLLRRESRSPSAVSLASSTAASE